MFFLSLNSQTVRWGPPIHVHGNLTKYIIKCTMVEEDNELLNQRDYCSDRKCLTL